MMEQKSYKKPKYRNLTVRQRLNISNVLMLVIPLAAALVCVVAFSIFAQAWMRRTQKLSAMTNENVLSICNMLISRYEDAIVHDSAEEFQNLEAELEKENARVLIECNGKEYYSFGKEDSADKNLLAAAKNIGTDAYVSGGNRQLYMQSCTLNDKNYRISIYIDKLTNPYGGFVFWFALMAFIFLAVLVIALILANHFLKNFVCSRILGPLDILSEGVHEIEGGNLNYRLDYDVNDEFRPVCEDFNKMSQQLQLSTSQLVRQEENRKELIAGISHDLRSPLTSISAYADGLLDGIAATPESREHYVRQIKQKSDEMVSMVSRLFMFSKMDLNEYPVHPEYLNLEKEVRELVEVLQSEYEDRGLKVLVTETTESPVYADPEQLHTLLTNIIENARKYKNKEIGCLQISIRAVDENFVLSLEDDGPGVPDEALSRLFEVFYRSDPSRKNPQSGSGLGLAIAAKAVERMHGTIYAENVKPSGLAIRIVLPKGEKSCSES